MRWSHICALAALASVWMVPYLCSCSISQCVDEDQKSYQHHPTGVHGSGKKTFTFINLISTTCNIAAKSEWICRSELNQWKVVYDYSDHIMVHKCLEKVIIRGLLETRKRRRPKIMRLNNNMYWAERNLERDNRIDCRRTGHTVEAS